MGRAEDLFESLNTIDDIHELINAGQSEELFLDYKNVPTKAGDLRLNDYDRKNFAKAISGFGNSEGGVIIWGVDCRQGENGDIPGAYRPVEDTRQFVSYLEKAASGCTLPPHAGISHKVLSDPKNNREGCVLTLIKKSPLRPHLCLTDNKYLCRTGSNYSAISHGVLAGMFGRPELPTVYPIWPVSPACVDVYNGKKGILAKITPTLFSEGPGLVKDLYATLQVADLNGGGLAIEFADDARLENSHFANFNYAVVSREGHAFAPFTPIPILTLKLFLTPPIKYDFSYALRYGCLGSPSSVRHNSVAATDLDHACKEILSKESITDEEGRNFVGLLIGVQNIRKYTSN